MPSSQQAAAQIKKMERTLRGYLASRQRLVDIAHGRVATRKYPAEIAAQMVSIDMNGEQRLASELHKLLTASGIEGLPNPDVSRNPQAAPQLARIALGERHELSAPASQGILPMLLLGGGALAYLTISKKIDSEAEVQKRKMDLECIKVGKCTDFGFWLKVASVAVIGWFVWDKVGVGERVRKAVAK